MSWRKLPLTTLALFAIVAVRHMGAQTLKVLYSFTGGPDGASPRSALILDSAGNLYGTTFGATDYPPGQVTGTTTGSVFKIGPGGSFTLLHDFGTGGVDGNNPSGGLIRDFAGNLYGATSGGGASTNPDCFAGGHSWPSSGCGEIFRIDANGNLGILYSFSGNNKCRSGCSPLAPLTLDAAGNLYGSTYLGGSRNCDTFRLEPDGAVASSDCGVVFELDTKGKETVLHRFGNGRRDGDFPNSGLILDAAGNIYGTAFSGGINEFGIGGDGVVFKLDPGGKEDVMFFFHGVLNTYAPNGSLIQDAAGNLYGTTNFEAFKLDSFGNFTELSDLNGYGTVAPLIADGNGNFYGTTLNGGTLPPICGGTLPYDTCGTVFKLDSLGNFTVLYQFSGHNDGGNPAAGLVMDAAGNLYGTTTYGGPVNSNCPAGCGVVFKITP